MKYDYATLYNKTADFYNAHPKAKRLLIACNSVLTWIFVVFYLDLILSTSLPAKDFTKVLFVPALAFLMVSVIRLIIERPRPYAEAGANITPLLHKKKSDNTSFPSRHLTCAVVIAMACLPFRPLLGGFLWLCSFALGYTRFATGLHYPSDLFAGAGVGAFLGSFIFIL